MGIHAPFLSLSFRTNKAKIIVWMPKLQTDINKRTKENGSVNYETQIRILLVFNPRKIQHHESKLPMSSLGEVSTITVDWTLTQVGAHHNYD